MTIKASDTNYDITNNVVTIHNTDTETDGSDAVLEQALFMLDEISTRADYYVEVAMEPDAEPDPVSWVLSGKFRISSVGYSPGEDPFFIDGIVDTTFDDGQLVLTARDVKVRVIDPDYEWIVGDAVNEVSGRRLGAQLGRELINQRYNLGGLEPSPSMTFETWLSLVAD